MKKLTHMSPVLLFCFQLCHRCHCLSNEHYKCTCLLSRSFLVCFGLHKSTGWEEGGLHILVTTQRKICVPDLFQAPIISLILHNAHRTTSMLQHNEKPG